jgi:hypothetical protein
MLRICDWTTLRLVARYRSHLPPLVTALVGGVFLTSSARAATIDWNVNPGPANYDSALDPDAGATPNWINTTQTNTSVFPVSVPTNAPVGIPATTDDAFVRNGGTATITSAVSNLSFTVGSDRQLYTDDGVSVITATEVGGNGTVNMTGGSLSGSGPNGLTLSLGGTGLAAAGSPTFTGTFNQSGGIVNDTLTGNPGSIIRIGNQAAASTPTSSYNLSGTGQLILTTGAGNNAGINVRNGTFNMTGGSITNLEAVGSDAYNQQFMRVATVSGSGNGPVGSANHAKAYANFSAGTVDVHNGLRVAPNNRAEGYVTISGTASLKLGNDLQLAANAGTAGSVDAAYGQLDMSGGYLQVGQYTTTAGHFEKKFILGDSGRGVFNMTGGNVLVGDQLRLSNNAASSALFTMKDPVGGPTGVPFTFTVRNVETRNNVTTDASLNSDVLIDSVDAVFIQKNMVNTGTGLTITGNTRLGSNGKSTFEIKKGNVYFGQAAVLGVDQGINTDLSNTANARATLKLSGGKLTLGASMVRTNTAAASFPVISLTGGQLVMDPTSTSPTTTQWQADLNIAGTQLTTRPGALLTVNVGVGTTAPGNFSMTSGSWDIDMSPGVGAQDALQDRIIMGYTTVPATGSLLGGTLNLNYLSGYVPQAGDSRLIVRSATGGVSSLGSIAINAPGGDPNWKAVLASSNRDIRLVYSPVPEPSTCVLAAVGLMMGLTGIRRKS